MSANQVPPAEEIDAAVLGAFAAVAAEPRSPDVPSEPISITGRVIEGRLAIDMELASPLTALSRRRLHARIAEGIRELGFRPEIALLDTPWRDADRPPTPEQAVASLASGDRRPIIELLARQSVRSAVRDVQFEDAAPGSSWGVTGTAGNLAVTWAVGNDGVPTSERCSHMNPLCKAGKHARSEYIDTDGGWLVQISWCPKCGTVFSKKRLRPK